MNMLEYWSFVTGQCSRVLCGVGCSIDSCLIGLPILTRPGDSKIQMRRFSSDHHSQTSGVATECRIPNAQLKAAQIEQIFNQSAVRNYRFNGTASHGRQAGSPALPQILVLVKLSMRCLSWF